VQCRDIVIHTGSSQHSGTVDLLARNDIDSGQVGVRRAEPITMSNSHGQDLGNASGKCDPTTICGVKRRADTGGDIDAPMSPVPADGCKTLHDISGERSYQSGA
jgi:hypothetical protein